MGLIYADIELINAYDIESARQHKIGAEEIRSIDVSMLVYTGSYMLAINENIQSILQLPIVDKRKALTADERIIECDVVSGVELRFENRRFLGSALVLPGDSKPVLGAIPMNEMFAPLRQMRPARVA